MMAVRRESAARKQMISSSCRWDCRAEDRTPSLAWSSMQPGRHGTPSEPAQRGSLHLSAYVHRYIFVATPRRFLSRGCVVCLAVITLLEFRISFFP